MSVRETDHLIHGLAREAGRAAGRASFKAVLAAAAAASLAMSVAMVLAFIGARSDLSAAVQLAPFRYKFACTLALGLGALWLAYRAGLPGRGRPPLAVLLPGLLLLAFRAATDRSGLSLMGNSDVSAGACVLTIVMVSVPPLVILLAALRAGAPTSPMMAGAIAGLLSGTLGAAAYALACQNDAGLFVATWYPAAILAMAALGAAFGRRALAW